MALTITSGPSDWSISGTNGKESANFIWGGHPDFKEGEEYYIYYIAKRDGKIIDVYGMERKGYIHIKAHEINKCVYNPEPEGSIHMDGEQLQHPFTKGSWTVQFFYCRDNSRRILTDSDRNYLDNRQIPPDWVGEEILESSNIWSWEVTD